MQNSLEASCPAASNEYTQRTVKSQQLAGFSGTQNPASRDA